MGATAIFAGGMTAAISAVLYWSGFPDPETDYFQSMVGFPDFYLSGHEMRVGKAAGALGCFLLVSEFVIAKAPRLARRRPLMPVTLVAAAGIVALSVFFVLNTSDEFVDAYVARLADLDRGGPVTEADLLETEEQFFGTTPETRGRVRLVIHRGAGPFVAGAGGLIALTGCVVCMRRSESRGGESNP